MSGGRFNYKQYEFDTISDEIKQVIEDNGREKTKKELREEGWLGMDYIKYPEDKFHYKYPEEVIERFKEAVSIIQKARIYVQRVDYLLSGDDGEESFIKRLNEELCQEAELNHK